MAGKPSVDDIRKWRHELDRLSDRIGPRFGRKEIRRRARVYLEVLLSNVPRKNGWQLAEHAGDATPKNIQHFLGRAKWNADEVRDDLQQYVVEHLARKDGVLIIDETGYLKKGSSGNLVAVVRHVIVLAAIEEDACAIVCDVAKASGG
jgi:SRSO17 transposase